MNGRNEDVFVVEEVAQVPDVRDLHLSPRFFAVAHGQLVIRAWKLVSCPDAVKDPPEVDQLEPVHDSREVVQCAAITKK